MCYQNLSKMSEKYWIFKAEENCAFPMHSSILETRVPFTSAPWELKDFSQPQKIRYGNVLISQFFFIYTILDISKISWKFIRYL